MTVSDATNDDRVARRYAGRPNPGHVRRTLSSTVFIRGFPSIPALAKVGIGCELRNAGRDMLIGLLLVRQP